MFQRTCVRGRAVMAPTGGDEKDDDLTAVAEAVGVLR